MWYMRLCSVAWQSFRFWKAAGSWWGETLWRHFDIFGNFKNGMIHDVHFILYVNYLQALETEYFRHYLKWICNEAVSVRQQGSWTSRNDKFVKKLSNVVIVVIGQFFRDVLMLIVWVFVYVKKHMRFEWVYSCLLCCRRWEMLWIFGLFYWCVVLWSKFSTILSVPDDVLVYLITAQA